MMNNFTKSNMNSSNQSDWQFPIGPIKSLMAFVIVYMWISWRLSSNIPKTNEVPTFSTRIFSLTLHKSSKHNHVTRKSHILYACVCVLMNVSDNETVWKDLITHPFCFTELNNIIISYTLTHTDRMLDVSDVLPSNMYIDIIPFPLHRHLRKTWQRRIQNGASVLICVRWVWVLGFRCACVKNRSLQASCRLPQRRHRDQRRILMRVSLCLYVRLFIRLPVIDHEIENDTQHLLLLFIPCYLGSI